MKNILVNSQRLEECKLNIFQTEQAIKNATVRARQSGFVNEKIKVDVGDYLNNGSEIVTIIPDNQNLKAIVNIKNSSISKIKIGQEVLFQIEDLPCTKFGKLKGKISLIPSDVIISCTSYFPVEVDLEKSFLQSKKIFGHIETVNLKVGTKASAKVIVDKNTIFQKILQKLVIYDKK